MILFLFCREKWSKVGKDIVVLHQCERSVTTPSPSPFSLKLETYLRMANIPYQVGYKQCFPFYSIALHIY